MGETIQKESISVRLGRYFAGRGFVRVDTHSESMDLYYVATGLSVNLIWMVMPEAVEEMTAEQYKKRLNTICETFKTGTYQNVSTLTLFLTKNTEKARSLGADTPFWIVDESYGRLIIYENQMEDYLGIRSMIEQNLHFGADIRNENGVQKRGVLYDAQSFGDDTKKASAAKMRQLYPQSLPRGRRKPLTRLPFITIALIICNISVYIAQTARPEIVQQGSNFWVRIMNERQYYRVFTGMFLHADVRHIANNMLMLYVVGSMIEDIIGHWKYLFAYLAGGIAAGIASCLYYWSKNLPIYSIGASGAVFAVTGIFAVWLLTTPDKRADMSPARLFLFAFLILYELGVFQFFSGSESNIDYAAHAGGFLFGTVYAFLLWLWMKIRKRRTL